MGRRSGPILELQWPAQIIRLLELQHHNLGIGTESQRRSPGACSAGSENLHLADPAQAINELPVNPPCNPTPGYELAEMGMTRKLQRDAGGFGNFRIVGCVCH